MIKRLFKYFLFLLVFLFSLNVVNAITLNDAQAYYSFDDNNFSDWTGNGYDLTNFGTTNTSGIIYDGRSFDGTSDYVDSIGTMPFGTVFSASIWIKSSTASKYYISTRDFGSTWWSLQTSGTDILAQLNNGATQLSSGVAISGAWQHIVLTLDGTNARIYVDGVLRNTVAMTTSHSTKQIRFGRFSTSYLNGQLDETAIYNKALNQTEINGLYNGGIGYNPYSVSPLVPTINFQEVKVNNVTNFNNTWYNSTPQLLEVTLNTIDTNNNTNVTLYIHNSTNDLITTNQFITNNLSGSYNLSFPYEDNFKFNLQALNNETNASSPLFGNYSIGYDITAPNISIIGNITQDVFEVNFSEIFNVTDSLSGLASCTINITYLSAVEPDSDFFIGCTDTQTFTRAGVYNGFIEALDNAGNLATLSINGTINPVINIFFNESNGTAVSNYTATVTNPLGVISQLLVNTNNPVVLSPIVNGTLLEGNYIIKFEKLGYVTENFTQLVNSTNAGINVTFNVTPAQIIVNIYDREDGSVFTLSTNVNIFGLGNLTTSTGQATFQDFNFVPGDYEVEAVSTGYYTEQQTFTYSGESNAIINIFLLDFTLNNSATLIVPTTDEWDNVLGGVDVRLQEYDTSILGFKQVSQCLSNSNGECQFLVEQSTKSYRIIGTIVINDITYTATNPLEEGTGETFLPIVSGGEEILGLDIIRQLKLKISETLLPANFLGLTIIAPVTAEETIVSENSTYTVINVPIDFISTSGLSYTVCFDVFVTTGSRYTSVITPVCTTGASGILPTANVTLNNAFDYEAVITVEYDGIIETFRKYPYPNNKSFGQILLNDGFVPNAVMFFWTILLALSMYMRNLGLWCWGAMTLAVVQLGMFANLLVLSSSVIIIVINGCVLYVSKKQVDLQ